MLEKWPLTLPSSVDCLLKIAPRSRDLALAMKYARKRSQMGLKKGRLSTHLPVDLRGLLEKRSKM